MNGASAGTGAAREAIASALASVETGWPASTVLAWLATEGRLIEPTGELLTELGTRLLEARAPVARLRLGLRTLHPEHRALGFTWTALGGLVQRGRVSHSIEHSDAFIGSPLQHVYERGETFRRALVDLQDERDHVVLHELAAAGGTDYLAVPLRFATRIPLPLGSSMRHAEVGGVLAVVTDAPGGFSSADLDKLALIGEFLAPIAEIAATRDLAHSLLDTYVGPRTGRRVLRGQIRRGDSETIDAAIWFSDLREFTRLTETLPLDELLATLNAYFELVAAAVTARGGEILRFIGDAMLIVFPIGEAADGRAACRAALDAAVDAFDSLATLSHRRVRAGAAPIRFGVGLHLGTVVYGNVGAPNRLDFTVMGRAVNRTARLESLTKTLLPAEQERQILVSGEFAALIETPCRSLGHHAMKGIEEPPEVFALAEP